MVVAGEGWPPGVVGLIAARLKERFERPAFALALNGAEATGSGRSIAGVDLGRVVRAAVEAGLAIKGGGHAMAAGVTLARARLGEFRAFLEERLAAPVATARASAGLVVDAAVAAAAATPALVRSIEAAGPFGAGNPEPVFALPRHRLTEVFPVGADHLRLRAVAGDGQPIEAIAFRAAGKPLGDGLDRAKGGLVHLAGTLSINRYGGRERAQLRVVDAAPLRGRAGFRSSEESGLFSHFVIFQGFATRKISLSVSPRLRRRRGPAIATEPADQLDRSERTLDQPRARVPDVVGSRLPRPYHFRARI